MTTTAPNIAKPLTPETWRVQDHTNRLWVERKRSRGWFAAMAGQPLTGAESGAFADGFNAFLRKQAGRAKK